jgi:ATPase subunit of ABC transporter with duplicated ATPase domains
MVLVSHDRALIDALATETWAIEEGGSLRRVLGGYSALLEDRRRERHPAEAAAASTGGRAAGRAGAGGRGPAATRGDGDGPRAGDGHGPAGGSPVPAESRRLRAAARSKSAEGRRLEAEITQVETALAETRMRLLDPATFRAPGVGAEVGREHDRLTGALAELYDRWAEIAGEQPGRP